MTMPDPRAYRRLAALLRDQITKRHPRPGTAPADRGMRHQHGHSRQTVTKGDGRPADEGSSAGGGTDSSWRTRMSNGCTWPAGRVGPLRPVIDLTLVPVVDAGPCAQRILIGPGPGQRFPCGAPEPLGGAAERLDHAGW
jgi:hypothetical protein